jgi:single-strand DNA-binding protein
MKTINKVEIIGHIGSIDIKEFQTGKSIVNLSIPTKNAYKKPDGEWQEDTEWHRCVISMPALVERLKGGVSKGDYVRVEGSIRTKKFTNKEGVEIESREITCYQFDMLSRAAAKSEDGQYESKKEYSKKTSKQAPTIDDDSDLPF